MNASGRVGPVQRDHPSGELVQNTSPTRFFDVDSVGRRHGRTYTEFTLTLLSPKSGRRVPSALS